MCQLGPFSWPSHIKLYVYNMYSHFNTGEIVFKELKKKNVQAN